MKKRIVSTLLALLMIVTLLPLGLVEPAEAAETLDCTVGVAAGKINPAYTDYVNRAMRYYIRNVSALSNVPDGQSILFFFEGVSAVASPNYKAEDYTKSAVRNAAVCLAVKFVNGTPEIYYCEDQCSTFPDMPLEFSYKANGYSPSTIYDGIYKVRLDNHLSGSKEDYAALTLDMSNNYLTGAKTNAFYLCDNDKRGTGKPFTNSQITSGNRSYQIHGHAGETTTQANSFRWSVGCILAGATYGEFSALMAGITGDSSLSSTGKPPLLSEGQKRNFGYVVIDRSQYTAQLEKVYTGSGSYTKNGTTAYYNITSADARDAIHELCKGSLGTDSGGGTTEDVIGSGNCGANGSNVTWKLTSDGTLTISGTGKMADYEWNGAPWARACSEITSIVIEDGVTSIGDYAFPFCTSLTSVTIPDTVTVIGHGAFRDCTSLTSVTIPNSVTSIGIYAFFNCSSLTSVTILGSVNSIGILAFGDCEALTSVTFSGDINNIGDYMFASCTSLTSVIIPDSVTSIGGGAFQSCTSLTSVTIPDTVTVIGHGAFRGCSRLGGVTIPDSVTSIGDWAFEGCTSLTSVTIPDTVTVIGHGAFRDCTSLTSVTIPGGVTDFGTRVFSSCSALKSVTFSDGVTSIGDWAFEGCTSLTGVIIPDSVTSIGSSAFEGCTSLTSLNIPDSVTFIGVDTFKDCTALTEIKLPSALGIIQSKTFSNCVNLTSITIPKSVTYISEKAFYCCDSLTDVYYTGTEADWAKIVIVEGNEDLTNAKLHAATIFTPANVELVGATPAANSITVTWQAAEGASTYVIYRKPAGTNSWAIIARNVSGTSYTDTGVTAGESYTYTVRGVAADGRTMSKGYDTKGVTAKVPAAVTVPANVTMKNAAVSGSSIVVTWDAAEGASTYVIYRKPAGTNSWAVIARNVSGTSYTDKSVTAGESYTYTVRGVAADGRTMSKGYDTKGVTAKAPAASGVPANVTLTAAKADSAGILVTWEAAANAQTYTVYRKLTGTNSWAIVARSVAGTAWKDIHADKEISYTYTVRGVAADGRTMSKSYDAKGVTDQVTKAITTPANVTMTAASSSGTGIAVTWEYALDAKTYVIYRKPTGTNNWAIIARNVSGTSYTDKSVTAGESYTYTVRGVAADGRTMSKGYDAKGVTAKAFAVAASSVTG